METVIYFATCDPEEIRRIRHEYGLTGGMNVNGEVACRLPDETLRRLQEEDLRKARHSSIPQGK